MFAFADSYEESAKAFLGHFRHQSEKQIITEDFTKVYKNLDNSQTIETRANRKITKHRPSKLSTLVSMQQPHKEIRKWRSHGP